MSNVKIITANKSNKQALMDWEDFRQQIFNSTSVDPNETDEAKAKRIKELEADPEKWFEYYFPKYCFAKPAKFQIKSTLLFLFCAFIAQLRAWFRGSAKSSRRMMEWLFKMLAQKVRLNLLLLSKSYENAERLLMPYMINLESNQRIINDYGIQEKPGRWSAGEFTTRGGSTFRAVGKGQNPRGTKNEELRVNAINADDLDDDEECRNPERLNQSWKWLMEAVIPTVDISKPYWIAFDNNIIAPDSLAVRFKDYATHVEEVNIRDKEGKSSWSEKNSEEDIDRMLSLISYEAGQQEFFNNPMRQGQTFKEITWGKCPQMKLLPFIISYSDPATSPKDKPIVKSRASNSCKVVALIGYKDDTFYLYNCYDDIATNNTFIEWLYEMRKDVRAKSTSLPYYTFIENNTLQDPFYQEVFMPKIHQIGKQYGGALSITPDGTKKPDKWFRIEATLEPLVRLGRLVFNIEQKDNPHMQRMEKQFLTAHPNSRTLDGPDAIQGGIQMIMSKITIVSPDTVKVFKQPRNEKRY
jgi:hypothetical protein